MSHNVNIINKSCYNRVLSNSHNNDTTEKTRYEKFMRYECGFIKVCIKGFLTECESRVQSNYKSWIDPILTSLLIYGVVCVDEDLKVVDMRHLNIYMYHAEKSANKFENFDEKILQYSLNTNNIRAKKLWIYALNEINDYYDADSGQFEYNCIVYNARELMYRLKEQEWHIDSRRRFNSRPRIMMHNEKNAPISNEGSSLSGYMISSKPQRNLMRDTQPKISEGIFYDQNATEKTYLHSKSNALQYLPLRDPDHDETTNTKRVLCQSVFHTNASKLGIPSISNTERFSGNKTEKVRLEEGHYLKFLKKIIYISKDHNIDPKDIITYKENEPRHLFNVNDFNIICQIATTDCIKHYLKDTLGYEHDCIEKSKLNEYTKRLQTNGPESDKNTKRLRTNPPLLSNTKHE